MSSHPPTSASEEASPSPSGSRVQVVVATTVMLSFISFWRAAAIVLCDLGSSAFFVGGIAEEAVGRAAPWFILGVMCFSFAVRAVYIESCVMFVRGGVYKVVKTALGGTLAKFSVSALMFDYTLTGPISSVAAGQYVFGFLSEILALAGSEIQVDRNSGAVILAMVVTLYFWRRSVLGIHESGDKALRIMQVTTAMVVLLILWCGITLFERGGEMPPAPVPENLKFSPDSLGWLHGTDWVQSIGLLGILIAFGHSILAMSGEESLAQINREIAYPKIKNLKRVALVIFVYSLVFTSLVSFFAVMIIPDSVRPQYFYNLIGGLAMHVVGPYPLRLAFHALVVASGLMILSGAVNTAMIGANGVLTRVSEDGVLSDWFRKLHPRYGTTYRILNLVMVLQLVAIVASRGDLYVLGEAYAFGVLWSFISNTLSMFVLRFKDRRPREWKVPLNLPWKRSELPLGILIVLVILLATALTNLLTKQAATVSGPIFALAFFILFTISERIARRKGEVAGLEHFQSIPEETIDLDIVHVRPAPVLVAVRDPNNLRHLGTALSETDTRETDVVVMTGRIMQGGAAGYREAHEEHLLSDNEQLLFTRVVALAEKMGKPVKLLAVPSNNPFTAVVNTAIRLGCSRLYVGTSEKLPLETQARLIGKAWEEAEEDPEKIQFDLSLVPEKGEPFRFQIGAHSPKLDSEDVELIHKLWLEIVEKVPDVEFHHRDVVSLALKRFEEGIHGSDRENTLSSIKKLFEKDTTKKAARPRR